MTDFDAVLKVVGIPDADIAKIKNAGIKRFTHFVTVPPKEIKMALAVEGMQARDISDVLAFQHWYHNWRASKPKQGIVSAFTMEVCWDYLVSLCSANDMALPLA